MAPITFIWSRLTWPALAARHAAPEKNERSDPTFTVFLVLAFIFLFSLMYAVWPVPPAH